VVGNGHSMLVQEASLQWQLLKVTHNSPSRSRAPVATALTCTRQDVPAARGVILALAKLCCQSQWHRRHLLALDICAAAVAGDASASNALISDFLDYTEPLSRTDPDAHLKARLKLQLQRNSVDIHIAQFAGHSTGAAAPAFAAVVGATTSSHTPKSAAFDSNAVNQVLQYCSDFLAIPLAIAAQVGKHVEEALEQDIFSQCRLALSPLHYPNASLSAAKIFCC
jgi:hypothetical protein